MLVWNSYPVSDGLFEYIQFDILQRFEFDAITGDGGLAYFLSIGFQQEGLVFEAHDVYR